MKTAVLNPGKLKEFDFLSETECYCFDLADYSLSSIRDLQITELVMQLIINIIVIVIFISVIIIVTHLLDGTI